MNRMNFLWVLLITVMSLTVNGQGTTTHAATGDQTPLRVVSGIEQGYFNLVYQPQGEEKVMVELLDAEGVRLYGQRVSTQETWVKRFNLSYVPAGNYVFKVSGEAGTWEYPVTYEGYQDPKLNVVIVADGEPGKVKLVCKDPVYAPVRVSIYNDRDQLLYEDQTEVDGQFEQVYNLSKVPADAVTFVVASPTGATYTERVSLRK